MEGIREVEVIEEEEEEEEKEKRLKGGETFEGVKIKGWDSLVAFM